VPAFANLPISRKLTAAFAAVLAVIFITGAVVYDRLLVIEGAKNRRAFTTDVLETLQAALQAMLNQETGLRGYLISSDESFLTPYYRGEEEFNAAIRKIKGLTADNPTPQRELDELNELAKTWHSEIADREIALMANPATRAEARALEGSGAGKAAMDLIRAKVDTIAGTERRLLAQREAVQDQAFATAYTMTLLGGTISLLVAGLMGVLLSREITVPITRMTTTMAALAKGDTGIEVPEVARSDEIGAMATAVQVFKESMIEREKVQAELAHFNRVETMGQLTGSIAHEINQPIAATVTNAEAALRWLRTKPPDLNEVNEALAEIVADGKRAGDIISRIRSLTRKPPLLSTRFDLNEAILDVIALIRGEVLRHRVSLQTQLAWGLPPIEGERIQLQQVMLNLILNAVEAMAGVHDGTLELQISTEADGAGGVLVTVRDSGPGLDTAAAERVFEAFYTTKPSGMGMGLAICRAIIAEHGGRMWVSANQPRGAAFQFTLASRATATACADAPIQISPRSEGIG
jgi:C4-dicarboxylate-specific signal transduction histidine kinase